MDIKPYDFGAGKLKASKAPMFFIHGDADGVRMDHIAEMFRLNVIIPMMNDFLAAKPAAQPP